MVCSTLTTGGEGGEGVVEGEMGRFVGEWVGVSLCGKALLSIFIYNKAKTYLLAVSRRVRWVEALGRGGEGMDRMRAETCQLYCDEPFNRTW